MSRMRLVCFGLLAALSASAVVSASASASGPYVYAKGAANPLMGSLELQITQIGNVVLNGTLAGTPLEVVCGLGKSVASAENVLTAGIEHFLGLHFIHFTMCLVEKPAGKGCLIQNELIIAHVHVLGISGPLVKATAEGGSTISTVTLDGCSAGALNKSFTAEGFISARPNNANSTIAYTTSSGSELKFGGNPATFIGEFKVEMLGGGELEIK